MTALRMLWLSIGVNEVSPTRCTFHRRKEVNDMKHGDLLLEAVAKLSPFVEDHRKEVVFPLCDDSEPNKTVNFAARS